MGTGGTQPQDCRVGVQCTGDATCDRSCGGGRRESCVCVMGRFFCGGCQQQVTDAGMSMMGMCPMNPQGADCDGGRFCTYQANNVTRGCVCIDGDYFCPDLPAPMGSPACPMEPRGCEDEGDVCARGESRSCICSDFGQNNIWVCSLL
jgi:hypothetical protein